MPLGCHLWAIDALGKAELVRLKMEYPNLHVSLGLEGGQAFSGHLHSAGIGGPYFVNVYLVPL